jgi:hypothetical protein
VVKSYNGIANLLTGLAVAAHIVLRLLFMISPWMMASDKALRAAQDRTTHDFMVCLGSNLIFFELRIRDD